MRRSLRSLSSAHEKWGQKLKFCIYNFVQCNKLAPKFIGPFTVTKISSPVAVRLKLHLAYRRVFHISKLKPVFHATINFHTPVPTPPRLVDGEPVYSLNRILDSRRRGHGFQYLVDWEGYGAGERSWLPARDILDHSLIDDYNRKVSSSGCALREGDPVIIN